MNKNYENLDKEIGVESNTISKVLSKMTDDLKKEKKEGVSLEDITKKLSEKKFGNKKK